jgi:hypothetical protein
MKEKMLGLRVEIEVEEEAVMEKDMFHSNRRYQQHLNIH